MKKKKEDADVGKVGNVSGRELFALGHARGAETDDGDGGGASEVDYKALRKAAEGGSALMFIWALPAKKIPVACVCVCVADVHFACMVSCHALRTDRTPSARMRGDAVERSGKAQHSPLACLCLCVRSRTLLQRTPTPMLRWGTLLRNSQPRL